MDIEREHKGGPPSTMRGAGGRKPVGAGATASFGKEGESVAVHCQGRTDSLSPPPAAAGRPFTWRGIPRGEGDLSAFRRRDRLPCRRRCSGVFPLLFCRCVAEDR
ncbi:hypothetical protein HPB48_018648 [Haemaphysalis longicornis]|uniref:Uncharacterized protein n=1 Tax=Haemaphysalis longicornis TaxID=44386 RepID=A0A9J6GES7_HAELO|nr:hypothetical protein HPB48_018648 [Haemaphysalis longicornis]